MRELELYIPVIPTQRTDDQQEVFSEPISPADGNIALPNLHIYLPLIVLACFSDHCGCGLWQTPASGRNSWPRLERRALEPLVHLPVITITHIGILILATGWGPHAYSCQEYQQPERCACHNKKRQAYNLCMCTTLQSTHLSPRMCARRGGRRLATPSCCPCPPCNIVHLHQKR